MSGTAKTATTPKIREEIMKELSQRKYAEIVDALIRDKKRKRLIIVIVSLLAIFFYLQLWIPDSGDGFTEARSMKAQAALVEVADKVGGLRNIKTINFPPTRQELMQTHWAVIVLDEPSDGLTEKQALNNSPHWKYPPANGRSFTTFGDPHKKALEAVSILRGRGFQDAHIALTTPDGKLVVVVCHSAMVNASLVFRKWGPFMGV